MKPFATFPVSDGPCVALTFDDGPDPGATPAVLDVLEASGVPATFFVVGERAVAEPAIVKRAMASGMGIGVHGWQHASLVDRDAQFVTDQLTKVLTVLWDLDADPCLFRPPFGRWDETILDVAERLGLLTVKWDVSPRDWSAPGPSEVEERVVGAVKPGSIVLLHDRGPEAKDTIDALPRIIERLRARGFTFVELGEQLVAL